MIKKLTCIDCPKGCLLSIEIEDCRVVRVSGGECPKGEKCAVQEIENPMRILTSAVLAEGLSLKMVPIRTDKPILKKRLADAMQEVKKIRLKSSVKSGSVIVENFLGLGVNLFATRNAS